MKILLMLIGLIVMAYFLTVGVMVVFSKKDEENEK